MLSPRKRTAGIEEENDVWRHTCRLRSHMNVQKIEVQHEHDYLIASRSFLSCSIGTRLNAYQRFICICTFIYSPDSIKYRDFHFLISAKEWMHGREMFECAMILNLKPERFRPYNTPRFVSLCTKPQLNQLLERAKGNLVTACSRRKLDKNYVTMFINVLLSSHPSNSPRLSSQSGGRVTAKHRQLLSK